MFRIGQGWDSHALVPERRLILGGVPIPFDRGLAGHSDADVLCHAIIDALFGALGLADIGQHFPDTDKQYHHADSIYLLKMAYAKVRELNYTLANLDSTILAEKPKLQPYILDIRKSISLALNTDISLVSVKAKTAEKIGPVGEGRSMEAQAVVLLQSAR